MHRGNRKAVGKHIIFRFSYFARNYQKRLDFIKKFCYNNKKIVESE